MTTITLPWPPSVNHYWRLWRGRMVLSRQGRAYRVQVGVLLRAAGVVPLSGPLAMHVELYPPDRRTRDIDNALKAIGDSLQHGGAFQDDSQIEWLLIRRVRVVPGGRVIVRLGEMTMPKPRYPDTEQLEVALIDAAVRYVVVADWFESRPTSRNDRARELAAMDAFNHVEADLRKAGGHFVRRLKCRQVTLERALKKLVSP